MLSARCSNHFMKTFNEYTRSEELKTQDDQKKNFNNRRQKRSTYKTSASLLDITAQQNNYNNNNTKEEDEEEEVIDIWRCSSREKKRQSLTIDSLSQTNIERLQRIHTRRRTLPENIFSQLKVKCKSIQNQRSSLTGPNIEPDGSINEEVDEDLTEEDKHLSESTKSLLVRRRELCKKYREQTPTGGLGSTKVTENFTLPQIKSPVCESRNNSNTWKKKTVQFGINNFTRLPKTVRHMQV